MMHGSELADARAAVWQSAAGRLLEVRDAADNLVRAHVRRSTPIPNPYPTLPQPILNPLPRPNLTALTLSVRTIICGAVLKRKSMSVLRGDALQGRRVACFRSKS